MLKAKLFILTISIISLSLVLSGVVYYKNINSIFQEQALVKFNHDKEMLDSFVDEIKLDIKDLSNVIASDENIKSSINLISNYENAQNYTKEIFDYEKENLLNISKQWINLNDNFSLAIYDKNKKLILINRRIDTKKDIGFVSYDNNKNKYFVNKVNPANREIPDYKEFKDEKVNVFSSTYLLDSYILVYFKPIIVDKKIIGYLKVCFAIEKETLLSIKNRFVNSFVLKAKDNKQLIFLDKDLTPSSFQKISDSNDYLLKQYIIIEDKKAPLTFISIIDKTDINEKLEKTLNSIIFIWIGILIITILLSYVFTDRYILNPIHSLQNSIRRIRDKRLKNTDLNENTALNTKSDELQLINEEFNTLANELEKNIAFLEGYKKVMDDGSIVSKSDLNGNITYVNENFVNITGYSKEESIGAAHNIVRHPDTPDHIFEELWQTIKEKKVWKGILKNKKKNGDYYWVDIVIRPILDENQNIYEYIAVRHDITEIIDQRETINKMINTDALTKLKSRHKLISDIQANTSPALAFLNIDSFRQVNDFYGHHFGDILIKKVAEILEEYIQEYSELTLYRTQADEFAILTTYNKDDSSKKEFFKKLSKIVETINKQNIDIENEEISVNLSSAISYEEKKNILSTANMALRRAKGQNIDIAVYKEEFSLDEVYANNIKWTKKLKSAISDDRIVSYYQPIVNNKTQEYEKYESLIRLIDEDGKVISPYFFLNIAKKSKNYTKLTKIMIKKSFEMFKDKNMEFSINLTIDDILNHQIKAYILNMLQKYELSNQVVFEIVESESIENFEKVVEFITEIKKHGCKIAIDDFGTGYSNFEYLMKLKADYIKIDGSMIKNIHNDDDAKMVVSVIVDFAKKMNMKTIAEYVENEEVLKVVNELGIDYSQGYHFSAPKATLD